MKSEHELLNKRFAYVYKGGGHPIYNPDQLLPDKPFYCTQPDPEWQERMNTLSWWASGYTGNEIGLPADMALVEKLRSFGGFEACVEYQDEDAVDILDRGQLWYGDKALLRKGAPSQCHRNACELWERNRKTHEVAIATGYALSKDGMWRQHSWLMHRKTRSITLVETTMSRVAYFGFVMTDTEAEEFVSMNY